MVDWPGMFAGVQGVVRSADSLSDGLRRLGGFAASNAAEYDEPEFWGRVASSEFPFDALVSWARAGLESLEAADNWSLVMLDCGDCPDTFYLAESQLATVSDDKDFLHLVNSKVLVSAYEFPPVAFEKRRDLAMHGVAELNHPILSYRLFDKEWHGANGELLWLAVATLALLEPLRDAEFCRRVLKGRDQLLLMSGFEEIFFYVGRVAESGLSFN